MKLTKRLLKIHRFEGQKGPQQSFALISCTAQAIQPNLVMSASFIHPLLDPKISLGKGGIFVKKYKSCRSHHDPLGFFPKVNLPF